MEAHNSNAKSIRLAASSDKSSYITSHLKKHAPSNLNHDPKMKSNLNSTKINSNTNIRNKPPVFPQKSKSINLTKPVMKVPNVSSSIHAPNSKNKNISHVSDKSKSANSIAQPRSITSFSRMTQQKLPVRLNMKSARSSGDLDDEMDLLKLLQFHNQNVSNRKC